MRIVMRFQYTEKLIVGVKAQEKEKIGKENAMKHCNEEGETYLLLRC